VSFGVELEPKPCVVVRGGARTGAFCPIWGEPEPNIEKSTAPTTLLLIAS